MIQELLLVSLIVFIGGLVKGFAGFGYAVIGVGLLSLYYPATEAIVLMIAPILVGNLVLVNEIEHERLESCLKNFWVFMISLFAGTFIGMLLIGSVPASEISALVGVFIILYASARTGFFDGFLENLDRICFRRNTAFQAAAGFISGTVFGSTSIGALVVSYLEGLDLDRSVFVGLLSFVFLFVSGFRIVFSWFAGYYPGSELVYLSLIAGFPGLIGVKIGSELNVPGKIHEKIVIAILLIIGLRLVSSV